MTLQHSSLCLEFSHSNFCESIRAGSPSGLARSITSTPSKLAAAARTNAGNARSFIRPRQQSFPSQTARPSSKEDQRIGIRDLLQHLCRSQAPCPFAVAHQNRLLGCFLSHAGKVDSNLWQLSLRRNHVRRHTTTSFDTTLSPRTISSVTRGHRAHLAMPVSASQGTGGTLGATVSLPPSEGTPSFRRSYGFTCRRLPGVRLLFSSTSISLGLT